MRRCVLLVGMVVFCLAQPVRGARTAFAAEAGETPAKGRTLLVGLVVAPPFVIKDAAGRFSGVSYDLWRDVAHDLGLTWQAREYDLIGLLDAVAKGEVDAGVSDLSITPEREEVMDFSQPFHTTGLGIAVSATNRDGFVVSILRRVVSPRTLLYAGSLLALLLGVGLAIWLLERRRNPGHFRPGAKGIGDGVWWSAVTMTAVGYGDSIPRTLIGRLLGLVWMFASVALLAFFTAGITTSLTVESMGAKVRGPEDLPHVRTGVKSGSAAENELRLSRVNAVTYPDVDTGLRALVDGRIDAFVHDQPVLQAIGLRDYPGLVRVLAGTFDPQRYGFAFPQGSALRKLVNVAMLRRLEDREYRLHLIGAYLGRQAAY